MSIITRKKPALFIHIPKTGGVSVSRWLKENVGGEEWSKSFGQKHADIQRIRREANQKDIELGMVFAVVRNPWDRVVSGHFYQKQRGNTSKDFKSWVMGDLGPVKRQCSSYVDPKVKILRLENIDEDFKKIQQYFDCFEPLPVENTSSHDHYSTYYDEESMLHVKHKFATDIKQYGYRFEGDLPQR